MTGHSVDNDTFVALHLANEALRLAMDAVLGPGMIHVYKFSAWESNLLVLELEFDTNARKIAMPAEKSRRILAVYRFTDM
ncbi:hypothetical protein PHMEG_00012162 [Phytophthora megakarya]|uniref:Uncharacterized protein n=1 Tax=Phytophthora megakarya TaxID=4795 RepID=A0A225W9F6_9STRA|nr:hypothetical protein PHMEG_00012162 [Phytophthora megakarya]